MKFFSAISTKKKTDEAILEISDKIDKEIGKGDNINLAFVFATPHHKQDYDDILLRFQKKFAPDAMLGCMGEGIIGGDKEIENGAAISLWLAKMPNVNIAPFHLRHVSTPDGISLVGWPDNMPISDEKPTFIALIEPFSIDSKDLLLRFQQEYPHAPILGGMVSGAFGNGQNRLFLNGDILDDGVIGVALTGDIQVEAVVSQGCRPIGESFIITKADRNIVQSLGGKPALYRFQEIFDGLSNEDKSLVQKGVHLGLVIDEYKEKFGHGDFLVRNIMGADQNAGSLVITDFVRVGQTAQFMIRDDKTAHEDLITILNRKKEQFNVNEKIIPRGSLIFSCNGRGKNLFSDPDHDVSSVRNVLGDIATAGFFAQGEVGPVGGLNFLHGFTASIAIFCEKS